MRWKSFKSQQRSQRQDPESFAYKNFPSHLECRLCITLVLQIKQRCVPLNQLVLKAKTPLQCVIPSQPFPSPPWNLPFLHKLLAQLLVPVPHYNFDEGHITEMFARQLLLCLTFTFFCHPCVVLCAARLGQGPDFSLSLCIFHINKQSGNWIGKYQGK